MTKEDFIRKITSRKLWIAIAGFVSGILLALKVDAQTAETVSGLILSGASVVAYIIAEGLVDSAGAAGPAYLVEDDKPPEDGEG